MERATDAVDMLERKHYRFHAELVFQPRCELYLTCLGYDSILIQTEGIQHHHGK